MKRKAARVSSDSSDDDAPLASSQPVASQMKSAAIPMPGAVKATTVRASALNGNGKLKRPVVDDSDSDDAPLSSQIASTSTTPSKPMPKSKRKVKKEDLEDDLPFADSEEDTKTPKKSLPPKKRRKVKDESDTEVEKKPAKKATKRVKKEEDVSESERPPPKKRGKAKKEDEDEKKGEKKAKGKAKTKKEEEEEVFKWWEQEDPNGDGTQKWTTLEHSGVLFPPPYEPLPKDVKMKYNGTSLSRIFSSMLESLNTRHLRQTRRSTACVRRGGWLLWCNDRDRPRERRHFQQELLPGLAQGPQKESSCMFSTNMHVRPMN